MTDRYMPIQLSGPLDQRVRRGERVVVVQRIPWAMIADEAGERQSQKNHHQSLDEIARRGGFSACEAICVMASLPWQEIGTEEAAHKILYAMHALFNRGQRVAEARAPAEIDSLRTLLSRTIPALDRDGNMELLAEVRKAAMPALAAACGTDRGGSGGDITS